MAERISRRDGVAQTEIPGGALGAAVMDRDGEWIPEHDMLRGIEAYRQRIRGGDSDRRNKWIA